MATIQEEKNPLIYFYRRTNPNKEEIDNMRIYGVRTIERESIEVLSCIHK